MGKSAETTSLKSAMVVLGVLAFGWMAIELAFKPFLEKARSALDKSDPTRDPDDDEGGRTIQKSLSDDDEGGRTTKKSLSDDEAA